MSSSQARYEGIADWYVEYTRDWEPEPLALLPDDIARRRVLDLACAHGRATRFLARCGASVMPPPDCLNDCGPCGRRSTRRCPTGQAGGRE